MATVDEILGAGLAAVVASGPTLHLCTREPRSIGDVTAATKARKSSLRFEGPRPRHPTGMCLKVLEIHDGIVDGSGDATHWAITGGGRLWAAGPLREKMSVQSGNEFRLSAFEIELPGA